MDQQEVSLAATGETPEAADSPQRASGAVGPNAAAGAPLTKARRQEIFRALVEAQDQGIDVPRSKRLTAERFAITEDQVRQIEEEGVDQEWPPL